MTSKRENTIMEEQPNDQPLLPKKSYKGLWITLTIILIFLAIMAGAVYYTYNQTCTMGVSSTAANVTFRGPQAQNFCSNPAGWQVGDNHFYALDQPQGDILCDGQITLSGSTAEYTVRDSGSLDIVGSELCKWLGEGAPDTSP
jgi:hypothetical protein